MGAVSSLLVITLVVSVLRVSEWGRSQWQGTIVLTVTSI